VLIVEDEPDTLLVLRMNLEAAGFMTSLAADGAMALERIDVERPDVVLLDLMLPVVDGWGVLADLRARPDAPRVVVCSAKGSERDFARAEAMGASAYVTKPFALEDVVAALWEALIRPEPAREPGRVEQPGLEGLEPA
jgi:DNA-binding response OmpR family regulator